jgi:GNAT superfamily N-acetyltransferase
VLARGFGEGPTEAAWVREMHSRIGLDDDVPWRHLLGRLDGEPVATISLFFASGVAGVYFACTTPECRGRGIGTAITHAAMQAARDAGFSTAVLGASSMGHRIYRKLGFRDLCTIEVYEWP